MICRFVKALSGRPPLAVLVLGMVFGAMPMPAWCQAPGYPQAQPRLVIRRLRPHSPCNRPLLDLRLNSSRCRESTRFGPT